MKTVSTKVDESVYQKLIESCGKSGNCISQRIRELIEGSLGNDTPISKESSNIEDKHESHFDKFGNYHSYVPKRQVRITRLNPENIRIKL